MNGLRRYEPGDHIIFRWAYGGRVKTAAPMIVVKDTPDLHGLWMPKGTQLMSGFNNGVLHLTGEQFKNLDWEMQQRTWQGEGSLRLKIPDSLWSLHVFWEEVLSAVKAWYINMDAPVSRSRFGFDSWGMFLDVVVSPDRQTWQYKDEDEFADVAAAGVFDEIGVDEIRTAAEEAIKMIPENQKPFDDSWAGWRPDPTWAMPQLPNDWELV